MALSKREKYIAIGLLAAGGLLGLDSLVLTPYMKNVELVGTATATALKRQSDAGEQLAAKSKLRKMIDEMKGNGLLTDASQAESQANVALLDWAADSRVSININSPERPTTEGAFTAINFHVTATGTASSIARLLYAIESSALPVRVSDVNLKSVKEQSNELQLNMSFSTLCISGDLNRKPGKPGSTAVAAGGTNP